MLEPVHDLSVALGHSLAIFIVLIGIASFAIRVPEEEAQRGDDQ